MFKRMAIVLFMLMFVCLFTFPLSHAVDLQLNDDWQAAGVTGLVLESGDANNAFTGGVFYGPVANLKSDSGKNVLGLGGLIGNLKSDDRGNIKGAIGITAVTAFDNMVQTSVVVDPTDFEWLDADSYMLAVTVDGIKATKALGSGAAGLLGIFGVK